MSPTAVRGGLAVADLSPATIGALATGRHRNQTLMQLGDANFRRIGPFFIEELGPSPNAIADLRERWNTWILGHREMLRDLQARMLDDGGGRGARAGPPP